MKHITRTSVETDSKDKAILAAIRRCGIRETARRAGLSPSAVCDWTNGHIALPLATVQRMIAAAKGKQ